MMRSFYLKIFLLFLCVVGTSFDVIGLSYERFFKNFSFIHLLVVNPNEHTIIPIRASGKDGRETVASLAKRYGATAAINGGFWEANGDPAGALKINGKWLATPIKPRGAIGWSLINQKVLIDRILTNYPLSASLSDSQIEVIVASTPPQTSLEEWNGVEHIVGGTPVLVYHGHLVENFSQELVRESFLVNKHSRTAVGIRNNGDWVFVVVDGRFCGCLGGMTIPALSQFMLDLGCIEALNLDGGGSSTMFIDGKVMNIPCGKMEEDGKYVEAVSDAILIF